MPDVPTRGACAAPVPPLHAAAPGRLFSPHRLFQNRIIQCQVREYLAQLDIFSFQRTVDQYEAVFREHACVADAALIGQPDEKWGEVGLMIVACKPNQTVDANELLQFCSERLAKYKIPKRVEFVDALPYSPYGKVIKAELKAMFLKSEG